MGIMEKVPVKFFTRNFFLSSSGYSQPPQGTYLIRLNLRKEKQPIHKVKMTEGKRNIIRQLLQEYEIESAEDIQNALKDLLGGTIKEMMEAEMDAHLGYRKSERSDTNDDASDIGHLAGYLWF